MYRLSIYIFYVFILLTFATSCRSIDRIFVGKPLGDYSEKQLIEKIITEETDFETLYFRRLQLSVDGFGQNRSVRANMFISRSEKIVLSIIPIMGIEAARILVNSEGIQVIDRINKQHHFYSYSAINRRFGYELDYFMIEQLLTNRLITEESPFYSQFRLLRGKQSDDNYILSLSQQAFMGSLQREVIFEILPTIYKVKHFEYKDMLRDSQIEARYSDFRTINGQSVFPMSMQFRAKQSYQVVVVEFNYQSVDIDSSHSLNFSVPSDYEAVTL